MCVILDTHVRKPCSRVPVHTTRELNMAHRYGTYTWVVCTEHTCPRTVLAKALHDKCFLPTRPVDRGARYTLPMFTAHEPYDLNSSNIIILLL